MYKLKNLYTYFGVIGILSAFLTACDREPSPQVTLAEAGEYIALAIGKYITYRVDSIYYYETIENDTIHVEIKEVITDTFRDGSNKLNYSYQRFSRPAGGSDWNLVGTGVFSENGNSIEKVEDNLRYIKLVSPVSVNLEWNGHAYLGGLASIPVEQSCNNLQFLEGWNFKYASVNAAETIGDFHFDAVVTVEQNGSQNLIEFNQSIEKYAKGIGMVYRFFRHYTTQNICPECIWEENTECGYSVKMTVIDYN
ncbi:MAG: hypothetical protein ACK4IY_05705 [Chitinophagales bacterium]